MKKYRKFEVEFDKFWKPYEERSMKDDMEETPAEEIKVMVWAENVEDAISKAWKTVTVSQNNYEILHINSERSGWRSLREDE